MIDKKQMTEEEIKLNFITPAIERTWPKNCIRMEFPITQGRIMIDGKKAKRGKAYFADYLLFYSDASLNFPLAVVEAKDNGHSPLGGLPQAGCRRRLNTPCIWRMCLLHLRPMEILLPCTTC